MNAQLEKIKSLLRMEKLSFIIDEIHHMTFLNSPQSFPPTKMRKKNTLAKTTDSNLLGDVIYNWMTSKAQVNLKSTKTSSALLTIKRVRFLYLVQS